MARVPGGAQRLMALSPWGLEMGVEEVDINAWVHGIVGHQGNV